MLRKYLLNIVPILLAFLVPACAGAVPQAPTTVPQASPTLPPATFAPTPTNQPACSVVSASYLPKASPNSPIPLVSELDWSRGPVDAPLTIIEYGDFQ
jgi:hypothetical protein